MKIYEGHNANGELIYFEVPNIFISRKTASKIIKAIPDVKILEENKRDDVFCIFKLGDKVFEIMEPFGDNSRFHIGEPNVKSSKELQLIKEKFSAHKPKLCALLGR